MEGGLSSGGSRGVSTVSATVKVEVGHMLWAGRWRGAKVEVGHMLAAGGLIICCRRAHYLLRGSSGGLETFQLSPFVSSNEWDKKISKMLSLSPGCENHRSENSNESTGVRNEGIKQHGGVIHILIWVNIVHSVDR